MRTFTICKIGAVLFLAQIAQADKTVSPNANYPALFEKAAQKSKASPQIAAALTSPETDTPATPPAHAAPDNAENIRQRWHLGILMAGLIVIAIWYLVLRKDKNHR